MHDVLRDAALNAVHGTFQLSGSQEPNPWRVFDAEENTFTWHAGDVARYANETEARQAADALNARAAANDPAVRLAELERANRRTSLVQAVLALVLVPVVIWMTLEIARQLSGDVSHIAHFIDRITI